MIAAERSLIEASIANSKKIMWVNFQHEGIHTHKVAEGDVPYLATPHRHIFHIRVGVQINKDELIEPIKFKRWLENFYRREKLQLGLSDCIDIANDLYMQIWQKYPYRSIWIDISEDGDHGYNLEYLM